MGDAHVDRPAVDLFLVKCLDCPSALLFAAHHHKPKSAGASGGAIEYDFRGQDRAVFLEELSEVLVGLRPRYVAHEELGCHRLPSCV